MAGKRNLLDDPPTASSSDEEEVGSSIGEGADVEGNSSSEEEEGVLSRNLAVKKPETALAALEEQKASDSESGSEEEADSDPEANPVKNSGFSVTETKDSVAVKNQDSKKGKLSAKLATKKRASETDGSAAKKAKRVSGEEEKKSGGGEEKKSGGGEETKKAYFQRVWSEEDEIAVLQGLIDYKANTGVCPYDDTNGFYQLVKKSISFDVSKVQLMEKRRSLKKKFEKNNLGKVKNGEEPTFSKPHDSKAFELSKIIWGADGMALEPAVKSKSNGKSKKSRKLKNVESVKPELVSASPNGKNNCEDEVADKREEVAEWDAFVKSDIVNSLARIGVNDLTAQKGWSRLALEDKKIFEEQWNALQLKELVFYSRKTGFFHEVLTKMAEASLPIP